MIDASSMSQHLKVTTRCRVPLRWPKAAMDAKRQQASSAQVLRDWIAGTAPHVQSGLTARMAVQVPCTPRCPGCLLSSNVPMHVLLSHIFAAIFAARSNSPSQSFASTHLRSLTLPLFRTLAVRPDLATDELTTMAKLTDLSSLLGARTFCRRCFTRWRRRFGPSSSACCSPASAPPWPM